MLKGVIRAQAPRRLSALLALCSMLLPALTPVHAQVNLAGGWGFRFHEDYSDRWPGPRAGDYMGLPLNDAARMAADSWNPALITMPERQCIPHPSDYGTRSPANLVWWSENDPGTQRIIAWKFRLSWMSPERTIWMDGRPHPPANARHTRQGFTTGKWVGDTLVTWTTHLKLGYVKRNGVPRSDRATFSEHWMRNGPYLTLATVVYDPVYLTAPHISTETFVQDDTLQRLARPCYPTIEVPREKGVVPTTMPWANPDLRELALETGLPLSVVRGGADMTYPEYIMTLSTLPGTPPAAR